MKPFSDYQNPAVAVDLVVFGYSRGQLSVLMLNRKEEPFQDRWTLPGAFVAINETFQDACTRILSTKLGAAGLYLEQLFTFDDPQRDPRGRVISVAYYALVNPARFATTAGNMANDVKWFPITEMPEPGFDHRSILNIALRRLQGKIMYYPVGFELLDEEFTMSELHQLYECILSMPIDRRNFSRKILEANFIEPTGHKREGLKNRHPELFRFIKSLKEHHFHLKL